MGAPFYLLNIFSPSSHNGRSHGSTTCTTCTTSTAVMGRQVSPDATAFFLFAHPALEHLEYG